MLLMEAGRRLRGGGRGASGAGVGGGGPAVGSGPGSSDRLGAEEADVAASRMEVDKEGTPRINAGGWGEGGRASNSAGGVGVLGIPKPETRNPKIETRTS